MNAFRAIAILLPALFPTYAAAENLKVLYSNAYVLKTPIEAIIKGVEASQPRSTKLRNEGRLFG